MLNLLSPLPKKQQRSNAGVDSKSSSAKGIKTHKESAARTAPLPVHALIVQKLEEPSPSLSGGERTPCTVKTVFCLCGSRTDEKPQKVLLGLWSTLVSLQLV